MTIPYEKIGKKIYDILAAANYNVEMFDNQSNKTYDVEIARKFFIVPGNSMVSIHESDDDEKAKISVSLSPDVDIAMFEQNVGKALKHIAAKYGRNMGYSIRKFGHELQPRDFAHQIKKVEEGSAMVNKTVSEAKVAMTGTTRSSYQRVGECKVIIRHTDKINEDKFGARSRNINAIFVETKNGERFKVAENNLHGARAMARHLSNGGSPFDTVGIKVSSMMEEMSSLKNMMAEVKSIGKDEQLVEQSSDLAGKIRTRFIGLRETLRKMSGKVGYFRQTSDLTESEDLDEYEITSFAPDRLRGAVAVTPPMQRSGKYTAGDKERMKREAAVRFANKRGMSVSADDIEVLSRILSSPAFMSSQEYKEYEAKVNEGLNEYTYDPEGEPESGMDKGPKAPETYSSPAQELMFKMQDALAPPSKLDHPEWVQWSRASESLGNVLGAPEHYQLSKDDMLVLFNAAKSLGVNIRKASTESIGFGESIWEDKNVDGETDVEEKSVDTKPKPKEDEVPNMIQAPEYDRPTGKTHKLVRDNSEGLHSVNYYKEGVAPEETMLEEWFDQMADVEFFKEEELIIEEDKTPKVEKILPETALHRLNLYVGHPLFERYVSYYEERKMFDDILNLVEEDSKLWKIISETRQKLTEFMWGDMDPQVIEDAVDKLKDLKAERRIGMNDAIDKVAQEISDGFLDGSPEAKETVTKELRKRAEEEGLIDSDFGGKFADAALSNNEVIAGDKNEIDAEQYYGPAKFGEADAPMDAGRSRYTATTPPDFGDSDGPPEELEPCRKCGDRHEGPCPLYDAEAGLRQVGNTEIQAIWGTPDVETKRQLSLELIQDFHFKDQASRTLETNKLNAMVRPEQFDRWASNMLLHGEGLGFGTGRGPRRRESIEHDSDLARISELAGLETNDVEEDAASEKKLGRRKAGSYGKPGSKQQKRMAGKSSRRAGKEDIKAGLKKEDFGAYPDPEDGGDVDTGTYGRRMKPLPLHPDEKEEDFNAHTDESVATFDNMPLLLDQKKEEPTDESIATFDNMPLLLDQKKEEPTDEPEIAEDFSDEATLSNMPTLLKQAPEEPTGEPELSEDGARIIQLARYRN